MDFICRAVVLHGQERHPDLRKICRMFRKTTDTLGAPVLQRRKPMLLFRLAQRKLSPELFQLPPRFTRLLPLVDTFPKSLKFLAKPGGNPLDPLKRPFFYAPFGAEE